MTERTPPRAEVVGSLLRPPALRAAIEAFYEPGHSAALDEERAKDRAALRAAEDDAIREAVRRQRDCGLDVITPRLTLSPCSRRQVHPHEKGTSPGHGGVFADNATEISINAPEREDIYRP